MIFLHKKVQQRGEANLVGIAVGSTKHTELPAFGCKEQQLLFSIFVSELSESFSLNLYDYA